MIGRRQSLEGQTALITGASGGLGSEVAKRLASKGVKLFLTDHSSRKQELVEVVVECQQIAEAHGFEPEVDWEYCDVRSASLVSDMVEKAVQFLGRLDIVFVNAGIAKPVALGGDIDVADQVMAVNFKGVQNTVDACLPYIEKSKGYILVNASMGAIVLLVLMATAYGASKAAAAALAQGVNMHFKGTGARCAALFLAEHDTPMEKEFEDEAVVALFEDNPRLARAHRKRDPEKAVNAIVRAMEKRRLYVHAPYYTILARWFPAVPNWVVRNFLVQNPQRALKILRDRAEANRSNAWFDR